MTDKPTRTATDQVFATVEGTQLLLDVTVPLEVERPPLVVWIHGGGWRQGSYKNNRMSWITDYGYAVASIGYRLTDKATFPAQIHDCKGAVRWLRAHAAELGYSPDRVAASGSSAGGHLAMLLGTTAGIQELEGDVGGNLKQSSKVSAVVQYWGPSDFVLRAKTQPSTATTSDRGSFRLLNGQLSGRIDMELARKASPASYVDKNSPPMLSFQGLADDVVLPDQAHRIADVYREHGLPHELHLLPDVGHGSQEIFEGEYRGIVVRFLNTYL